MEDRPEFTFFRHYDRAHNAELIRQYSEEIREAIDTGREPVLHVDGLLCATDGKGKIIWSKGQPVFPWEN